MINFLLYTGLGFASIAAAGLLYGMATTYLEYYRLVENKAVRPNAVKVRQ